MAKHFRDNEQDIIGVYLSDIPYPRYCNGSVSVTEVVSSVSQEANYDMSNSIFFLQQVSMNACLETGSSLHCF